MDGDSGSWVVDTTSHEVCGYIVASDVFGEAYVIPFMDGLESIKQELGASCVELMDPSDIAPQRIELAPLIDPTARNREQISHAEQEVKSTFLDVNNILIRFGRRRLNTCGTS